MDNKHLKNAIKEAEQWTNYPSDLPKTLTIIYRTLYYYLVKKINNSLDFQFDHFPKFYMQSSSFTGGKYGL